MIHDLIMLGALWYGLCLALALLGGMITVVIWYGYLIKLLWEKVHG